jgi:catechol 2,3-dioxygenase-like lactoylglutathione lyase family enzyme
LADLEVGGLQHTSSITKDAPKNVGLYTRVLGMRLVYRSVIFDDPSIYYLAYTSGASSTGSEEGPAQEELVAVRSFGWRVAEKATLLVGAGHTFRKEGSK